MSSKLHQIPCNWDWCREISRNVEDLARHVKHTHFSNITAVQRRDWDIWVKANTGKRNPTDGRSLHANSSNVGFTPDSRGHRTPVTPLNAALPSPSQTSRHRSRPPSPRSPQTPEPTGSHKRSFSDFVAESSPSETPPPQTIQDSPRLSELVAHVIREQMTSTTPVSPTLVLAGPGSPLPSLQVLRESTSTTVYQQQWGDSIQGHPRFPSRHSSNETSTSTQDVEAHLTQVISRSISPLGLMQPEPESSQAQNMGSLVKTDSVDSEPFSEPVVPPGPPEMHSTARGDSMPPSPQSPTSPPPLLPPPPVRRSSRARSRTPAPVPLTMSGQSEILRKPRKAKKTTVESHVQLPFLSNRRSFSSRARSEQLVINVASKRGPKRKDRTIGLRNRQTVAPSLNGPIVEAEEEHGEDEYQPEGNPFNDERGKLQNGDRQQYHIAGGEPVRDPPVPELSSVDIPISQTQHSGWGHSQLVLQTQAPYQSQPESQSQ